MLAAKRLQTSSLPDLLRRLNEATDRKWGIESEKLHKSYSFRDFEEAFNFISEIAGIARSMNHHPDWRNSYNRVDISLQTHSVEGLSKLDFEMASKIDSLLR